MNPEQLIKHLVASGIPEAQAKKIVESMPGDPSVNADALTKALGELKDLFSRPAAGDAADAEKLQKALNAAETADAARSAVSELGDALLDEVRTQNEALCKGLLHMGETVVELATENGTLKEGLARIEGLFSDEKGIFGQIAKALNVPMAPRAIRTQVEDILAPPGETPAPAGDTPTTLADRMSKAIEVETFAQGTTSTRRRELAAAASAMNSGMPLETIAKSYNIDTRKA